MRRGSYRPARTERNGACRKPKPMLPKLSDRDALRVAVHGYYFSSAIYAVVNLGIVDALA
jgi:hypothetical protein